MNPSRRSFLSFTAASTAALVVPPKQTVAVTPQEPALLERVISFICNGPYYNLNNIGLLTGCRSILAVPSDYGCDVKQVIKVFKQLRNITYGCSELKIDAFSGITISDLVSPEWNSLELRWLPVVKKKEYDAKQSNREYARCRKKIAEVLTKNGFSETTLLNDAADAIEPRCITAAQTIINLSYSHDPVGFVHEFHKHPSNVGLQLHYCFRGDKEYQSLRQWIPVNIANHIESTFPFSRWPEGKRMKTPKGLSNRIFGVGRDQNERQLFHIALSLDETRKAVSLLVGSDLMQTLSLREANGGGVILTLDRTQTDLVGRHFLSFLPVQLQPEAQGNTKREGAVPSLDSSYRSAITPRPNGDAPTLG